MTAQPPPAPRQPQPPQQAQPTPPQPRHQPQHQPPTARTALPGDEFSRPGGSRGPVVVVVVIVAVILLTLLGVSGYFAYSSVTADRDPAAGAGGFAASASDPASPGPDTPVEFEPSENFTPEGFQRAYDMIADEFADRELIDATISHGALAVSLPDPADPTNRTFVINIGFSWSESDGPDPGGYDPAANSRTFQIEDVDPAKWFAAVEEAPRALGVENAIILSTDVRLAADDQRHYMVTLNHDTGSDFITFDSDGRVVDQSAPR